MQTELAFSEKFMLMVINGSYGQASTSVRLRLRRSGKKGEKENSKWIRSGSPVKLGDIFV